MSMPFNWFDIAILLVLALGVQRGRKHGMSFRSDHGRAEVKETIRLADDLMESAIVSATRTGVSR